MALKNQERQFVNKFKAGPIKRPSLPMIDNNGAFVRDIETDFKSLMPKGLAASRFDGFFAQEMPFPSLVYETQTYAEDFLCSAPYLFGNHASPCFLKAIQELQKHVEQYSGHQKIADTLRKTMRGLYQELDLREMIYYKMKMSQSLQQSS